MRVEYLVVSIVLVVIVLAVVLGFAGKIIPGFNQGWDAILKNIPK